MTECSGQRRLYVESCWKGIWISSHSDVGQEMSTLYFSTETWMAYAYIHIFALASTASICALVA